MFNFEDINIENFNLEEIINTLQSLIQQLVEQLKSIIQGIHKGNDSTNPVNP